MNHALLVNHLHSPKAPVTDVKCQDRKEISYAPFAQTGFPVLNQILNSSASQTLSKSPKGFPDIPITSRNIPQPLKSLSHWMKISTPRDWSPRRWQNPHLHSLQHLLPQGLRCRILDKRKVELKVWTKSSKSTWSAYNTIYIYVVIIIIVYNIHNNNHHHHNHNNNNNIICI